MKFQTRSVCLMVMVLLSPACTTHPHSQGRGEYLRMIQDNSAGDKQFSGFYENFEFRATLFTRDVSQAIHHRLKQYYDWTLEAASQKLRERMDELNKNTRIWLSFYTPNTKDDNLANKLSIWKIYLVNQGKRFEGKASPANINESEAKALIPYHSRWATAYYVDFPVPTDHITGPVSLVITGPLGRRTVNFPER